MKKLMHRAMLTLAALTVALTGWAWGQKGHDITAYIAETHLTPTTKAAVLEVLDGKSPVYWANWLDNASHTAEYAYSKTWHYKNVDADKTYDTMPKAAKGDVVTAIRHNIGVLTDKDALPQDRAVAMRMLVHLVGDMHQPMHMGHLSDLGGNQWPVVYFGRPNKLHTIWDSNLLESAHKWSYTEWADQLDRVSDTDRALLQSGNIDDWARRTVDIATQIYNETPQNSELSYNEVARWAPVIEDQLLAAGYRLAHILNSIYDPGYADRKNPADF